MAMSKIPISYRVGGVIQIDALYVDQLVDAKKARKK